MFSIPPISFLTVSCKREVSDEHKYTRKDCCRQGVYDLFVAVVRSRSKEMNLD
jgi:hypothetical protein